jgi:hypothetical protein
VIIVKARVKPNAGHVSVREKLNVLIVMAKENTNPGEYVIKRNTITIG